MSFAELLAVYVMREQDYVGRAGEMLTELKGILGDIPSSDGSVLARLPSVPVILVLEYRLPHTAGVRPLLGALESALGLVEN